MYFFFSFYLCSLLLIIIIAASWKICWLDVGKKHSNTRTYIHTIDAQTVIINEATDRKRSMKSDSKKKKSTTTITEKKTKTHGNSKTMESTRLRLKAMKALKRGFYFNRNGQCNKTSPSSTLISFLVLLVSSAHQMCRCESVCVCIFGVMFVCMWLKSEECFVYRRR